MKISVRGIPQQGLDIAETISSKDIGLESEFDVKFLSPLAVKAHVERVNNTVLVNTKVDSSIEVFCARCLEPLSQPYHKEFRFDYDVAGGVELLDVDEDIRQEILLNIVPKILCRPDCKGICPGCGVNLNEAECKCKSKGDKSKKIGNIRNL